MHSSFRTTKSNVRGLECFLKRISGVVFFDIRQKRRTVHICYLFEVYHD